MADAKLPEKVHFAPCKEAAKIGRELAKEASLRHVGVNIITDTSPNGKLMKNRKYVTRKDVIANPREPSDEDADEAEESEAGNFDEDESLRAISSHENLEDVSADDADAPPKTPKPQRECLMNDRLSGILEKLKASDDTSLPTGSDPAKRSVLYLQALWDEVWSEISGMLFGCSLLRWSKDDDEIPLQHAEADEKETRKCKRNKASCAKATDKAAKQIIAVDSNNPAEPHCLYKPAEFQEERFKFINRMKEKKGISYHEASAMWKTSKKRAKLLSGLSESQMKKRRFI
ncbi:unnamed protein product [Symbiodinium microadriaticum]|nr:unnamed protein product [Symbiodinium microadriaticum]